MRDDERLKKRAGAEAATWHARLGSKSVTSEVIAEFFEWRRNPLNDSAYRDLERIWTQSRDLHDRPAIQAAIDRAMSQKPQDRRKRLWVGGAGLAAASVVGLACAGIWLQNRSTFSTDVGGEQILNLSDGSVIRLDTASRVTVRYDGRQRLVELGGGRALFHVAHDGDRPFIVRSGETDVRAVGTVFDVRRSSSGVTVSMVEGVVEVTNPSGDTRPQQVRAGHQIRLSASNFTVIPIDPAIETSWSHHRLVFKNVALADAVSEVNRYLDDPIILGADIHKSTPVSGVFRTGDREAFTAAAALLLNLAVVRQPDGGVRLEADKNREARVAESSS